MKTSPVVGPGQYPGLSSPHRTPNRRKMQFTLQTEAEDWTIESEEPTKPHSKSKALLALAAGTLFL
jgi:hypothetical protein